MRSFVTAIVAAVIGVTTVWLAVARGAEPAKTLEETAIDGEVRLPEVLFITSRDVERPVDWLEQYLIAEEEAAATLEQAPVRLLVFPDAMPTFDVEPEVRQDPGPDTYSPEREIEEDSR